MTRKNAFIEAVVGIGTTELGGLDGLDTGSRANLPDTIAWDAVQYLVGTGVHDYTNAIAERLDFRRLSEGPELIALTYATLGHLLGPGQHTLTGVVIGLPVEVMEQASAARSILNAWKQWLVGEHKFKLNKRNYTVAVQNVAVYSQPGGGFAAYAYNDQGQEAITPDQWRATTVIVDIGFNTLDVQAYQGGKTIRALTGGDTAGMRRAAEVLARTVGASYGVKLTPHQADAILRMERPEIETRLGFVQVAAEVAQAKAQAAAGIASYLENKLSAANGISVIRAIGGGSASLRAELLRAYPQATIPADPVGENALGLARIGRRAWKDGNVVGLDPGFGGFKAVLL